MTFESHHQALGKEAIGELLAHHVNYRKQVSPSFDDLLPEEGFRLFAVCSRMPNGLAERKALVEVQLERSSCGCRGGNGLECRRTDC